MSTRFLHRCLRIPNKAIGASLLAGIGLASASLAQAFPFNPSQDRTPYQLVSNDGRCLQASAGALHSLALANCDPGENLQKFYVLQDTSDADLSLDAPGTGGSVGRVVLAPTLDAARSASTRYQFVGIDDAYRRAILGDPTASASDRERWTIVRYSSRFDNALKVVAVENSTFQITELQIIYFGVPGQLIEKVVSVAFRVPRDIPCTNAFFGGDPAPGIVKACYVHAAQRLTTKYNVKLKNVAALKEAVRLREYLCLAQDPWTPTAVGMGVCNGEGASQDPMKSDFTLRPTSYPM